MSSQLMHLIILVLVIHLHACHNHNHGISRPDLDPGDIDLLEVKVTRVKRHDEVSEDSDPEKTEYSGETSPDKSTENLDLGDFDFDDSSRQAARSSGHWIGPNEPPTLDPSDERIPKSESEISNQSLGRSVNIGNWTKAHELHNNMTVNDTRTDEIVKPVELKHATSDSHSEDRNQENQEIENHELNNDGNAEHDHEQHTSNEPHTVSVISQLAIRKLFAKYGDGKTIGLEGFEHLLESLRLGNILLDDHTLDDHFVEHETFQNLHNDHDHIISESHDLNESHHLDHLSGRIVRESEYDNSKPKKKRKNHQTPKKSKDRRKKKKSDKTKKNQRMTLEKSEVKEESINSSVGDERRSHDMKRRSLLEEDEVLNTCLSPTLITQMLTQRSENSTDIQLSETDFLSLCPILIYQLDGRLCDPEIPCKSAKLQNYHNDNVDGFPSHFHSDEHGSHGDDDHYYDDHDSVNRTAHTEESHGFFSVSGEVWGYALLACVIISVAGLGSVAIVPMMHKVVYNHLLQFLVALAIGSLTGDAFLHLLPHAVTPHDNHDHDAGNPSNHTEHDKTPIWIGCVALAGMYFFLLAERIMGIITKKRRDSNRKKRKVRLSPNGQPFTDEMETHIGAKLSAHSDVMKSCEEALMVVHPNKGVRGMAAEAHDEIHQNCDPGVRDSWAPGHSHGNAGQGHHHSHEVPGSVASVAWMVIMGDGLHNFSDGLAIGAAFASGLTSGLSTSIAVFCHELPHELGDFAVLLRAGMSVKQALIYNCVSSVLCLFGMVVGIAVGNLEAATQWVFAIIAGMFIYIALVDMLPEISNMSPKEGESPAVHLLIQNAGLVTGAVIMLLIALYEDKIQIPHWEP